MNVEERVLGCLWAGAVGDGYASFAEFVEQPPPSGPDWRSTDDTALTLGTCRAIRGAGAVVPEAIAAEFLRLYRRKALVGLGASTLEALRGLDVGGHWALVGRTGEMAAGNGAAMRVAPLGFVLDVRCERDRRLVSDVVRITHRNQEALASAMAILWALSAVVFEGIGGDGLLEHVAGRLHDSQTRDNLLQMAPLEGREAWFECARALGMSSFAATSVPLALFAALRMLDEGLEPVLRDIVEAGGDTDTVASMASQVAGAALGLDFVPLGMRSALYGSDEIGHEVSLFAKYVARS